MPKRAWLEKDTFDLETIVSILGEKGPDAELVKVLTQKSKVSWDTILNQFQIRQERKLTEEEREQMVEEMTTFLIAFVQIIMLAAEDRLHSVVWHVHDRLIHLDPLAYQMSQEYSPSGN